MSHPADRYVNGSYFHDNPTWNAEDSPWKAKRVAEMLRFLNIIPKSICEVGCGAGRVLAELHSLYPQIELYGYDIAPDAAHFWAQYEKTGIHFQIGDFLSTHDTFDVILLLDVIEHIADPFTFLMKLRNRARYFLFHFPLDLSVSAILRRKSLLHVRKKIGHIHYFTKDLALALLEECGFTVIKWRYSGVAFHGPRCGLKTRLASLPRFLVYSLNKDWGVRVLGGETLLVLARS